MTRITDGRDVGAFIPADIDDLGLDSKAFRIYAHIAIKGGEEGCHRTISGLAKHCRISKGRVTEAIKTLLELGLIQKNGIFYRIKK